MAKRDANDILREAGSDALRDAFDRSAKRYEGNGRENDRGADSFTLTPFKDIAFDTSPTHLVKGLIPSGGLTVVWGPPKCGKSFWTFDLVMCIARGVPYRDRHVRQGPVVYMALEGGKGFARRVEAYRRQHDVTEEPFYLITDRTDLVRDHEALIAAITEQSDAPVAVVIDTLNRSLAGSESKDEDMAAYIRAADTIREAFGCAVIVVHHCGIDGSRPRGHTSLGGAADAQIAVERDEATNNVTATVEWMKDGEEGAVIVSRLERVELGRDPDGELITSCIVVPVDTRQAPQPVRMKKKSEPKSLRVFRAAFTEALDVAGKTIHVRGDGPAVRAVDLKDVKQQFDLRWATAESDDDKRKDAQRNALKRAIGMLPDREFATWVDGDTEWIWQLKR